MPNSRNYDFFIHAPNKHGRKSFTIIKREGKTNKSVKLPEIDAVNKKLKDGTIDLETAHALIKQIKDHLYLKYNPPGPVIHNENLQLLKDYWEKRYEHKDIKAKDAAYSRLRSSLEAIENLSLFTSSQYELQSKISKLPQQRKFAAALNQMLKYIGRTDVRIPLNRKIRKKPRYLTPKELDQVLAVLKHDQAPLVRILCKAAMGTGLRLGELFALTPQCLQDDDDVLFVDEQMHYDFSVDETKTRSDRTTPILGKYKTSVIQWIKDVPLDQKKAIRKLTFSRIVKDACISVFPKNPEKHCTFHDLRHSYAIELLRLGYGVSIVARFLGNSAQVCQEYYTGFTFSKDGIREIVKDLRQREDQ